MTKIRTIPLSPKNDNSIGKTQFKSLVVDFNFKIISNKVRINIDNVCYFD